MRNPGELLQQIAQRLAPRPFQCDSGVVVLPDGSTVRGRECVSAVATDAAPRSEPQLLALETMSLSSWPVTSDAAEMDEGTYLRSLYEGVPHATGDRLVQDYQRQKQLNEQLARAASRRKHA
jgi:hypothetical protein